MNKKGFTLIELLVVVAIIGILAAVGVVAYNGYTKSAKKSKCLDQSKFFQKEILLKWNNAAVQSGPDIVINGGFCFLHWLPSNANLGNKGFDIKTHIDANTSVPTLCNAEPQGTESQLHDHFYGMGYRNPLLSTHGKMNGRTALDTPNRGGQLSEGGSYFACGANAGFSDPYKCKLSTMCLLNETTEVILIKDK